MADDHFTLDIQPAVLRGVQNRLGTLADHLQTKGATVEGTPGDIGSQWTGTAADTIKTEMSGLGGLMKGFSTKVEAISAAVGSLAKDYEDALEQLPSLNQRYLQAQTDYDTAMAQADNAHATRRSDATEGDEPLTDDQSEQLANQRQGDYDAAFEARRQTWHELETSFGYLKQWLGYQTRALATTLEEQSPVEVPPSALEDLEKGKLPVHPFDHSELLAGMTLVRQYENADIAATEEEAQDDVEELQELLEDVDLSDSDAVRDALAALEGKADDPVYAAAFAKAGGPELVNRVYDVAQYYITTGESEEDDWTDALQSFNDVIASGLGEYSDVDLVEFTRRFSNPETASRLAAITGSEYADDRLPGIALALSWYMRYDVPIDNDGAIDIGRHMQEQAYPDGYEAMLQSFTDSTDPETLARVLNNASEDDREALLAELADLHANDHRAILDPDGYQVRMDMLKNLLESSRDQNFPGTFEDVLQTIQDHQDDIDLSQYDLDLQEFFTDPDTIDYLAQSSSEVDQELIAEMFKDHLGDEDVQKMLEELIARNGDAGVLDEATARNVGYLLGLAESAEMDLNVGEAMQPMIDKAVESLLAVTGKAAGPAGVAIDILKAFNEQYADAAENRANFGEDWGENQVHENLAWIIYLQNHGAPDSYQEWLADADAQQSVSDSDPLSAASQYLNWLEDPANNDQATAEEIRRIQEIINQTRDIA
ncbi:WXG100 family type VII secretion target [Nocardioides sp. W7]|uniref:WXG100 family type VII secretion target n=1 Tax=Nocardioides sp. W7 TaxID=2931390 RepID=UPI001FD43A67|nr:WXG100 family type VII secretion target [Nocardioides sp. W7]